MQYRKFCDPEEKVSALGFGAMRLPVNNDDPADIKEDKAIRMIRYAIDKGVNYIDTAWPYHKEQSEIVVGKALQDGYRERVKLATKLPSWLIENRADMDEYLDKQLAKLQTDYIDCYLLHNLNSSEKFWPNMKKHDVFTWLKRIKREGKIKYAGFSFHDDFNLFREIIDSYNWDFCQIQYNYLDVNFQAGQKGLKYAADKGLPVVIMEPLRGGSLALKPPETVRKIFAEAPVTRTPADWALQWLWNQPEVSLVLSGMSNMQQVRENIESATNSGINSLNEEELTVIKRVREEYKKISSIGCTGCDYCKPCPGGVEISYNFVLYNEAKIYDKYEENRKTYNNFLGEESNAAACTACGQCEEECPQNLPVIELLQRVGKYFNR